jgi:hypothetical protein
LQKSKSLNNQLLKQKKHLKLKSQLKQLIKEASLNQGKSFMYKQQLIAMRKQTQTVDLLHQDTILKQIQT